MSDQPDIPPSLMRNGHLSFEGCLTRKQTAALLNVSTKTVDRLVKKRILIPLRQFERWVRFIPEDVQRLIEERHLKRAKKSNPLSR